MTENNHAIDIIEDKLTISYEEADTWISNDPDNGGVEEFPEAAVLLITRCCKINHEHINLDKEQAMKLAEWLVAFANGEYDND
jgi:hypothetical protein